MPRWGKMAWGNLLHWWVFSNVVARVMPNGIAKWKRERLVSGGAGGGEITAGCMRWRVVGQ